MSKKELDSWSHVGLGEENNNPVDNPVDSDIDRDIVTVKPININNENESEHETEIAINTEKDGEIDMISAIDKVFDTVMTTKKDKDKPVFTGIYFEPDVAAAINKLAKKGGKGVKSKLVNDIVKAALQQKGLL